MDKVNDTSKASDAALSSSQTQLAQRIDAQRAQLLHAEDDDAVIYVQAAHVAANLINSTAEELDSVHIGPLIVA